MNTPIFAATLENKGIEAMWIMWTMWTRHKKIISKIVTFRKIQANQCGLHNCQKIKKSTFLSWSFSQ